MNESTLIISFPTLDRYTYNLYMDNETYYRIGNLDSRLQNPDQCLTDDVSQFCQDLAHIYSSLSKPMLDIVLMSMQLVFLFRAKTSSSATGQVRESDGGALVLCF
jgi:ATP-binding cassette subfamily D (ALD) protein 2